MTTTLRNGTTVQDHRFDRLTSTTTEHFDKYPLTLATIPSRATPVQAGFNVYRWLMEPVQRRVGGRLVWVAGDVPMANWGRVLGGHAVAFKPHDVLDAYGWWDYYDQGVEGRCPEFSLLRVLSLMNRKRYDITSRWHYFQMQREDEWAGGSYPGASPVYEGSSVRAALEVARKYGAIPALPSGRSFAPGANVQSAVRPEEGIAAYRWCRSWDDVRAVLRVPDEQDGIDYLQSWGRSHPRMLRLPDAAGERLLREQGEFGVVTDR